MDDYLPIEDYGVIGDLHTIALVGKNGSIDWCCLPRFDAPSVFGALLDARKGGYFRIAPDDMTDVHCTQMYLPDTNVLLTRFLSEPGVAELTDFMPVRAHGDDGNQHQIVRSLTQVRGSLTFTLTCQPAFDYAREEHTTVSSQTGVHFHSAHLHLALATPFPLETDERGAAQHTFTLHEGQSVHFLLDSHVHEQEQEELQALSQERYQSLFQQTLRYWRSWITNCTYRGRWRETVRRSALILKLLTYEPTGAIVAAPTTSLPEAIGGERNWDYRYTWLRDASFTLYSLLSLGLTQEARAYMSWLDSRCHEMADAGDGGTLQPLYGITGEHELPESVLHHLHGYRGSSPVRIGNGAYAQKQLDAYGFTIDAVYLYNRYDAISYDLWQQLERSLHWLEHHWQDPDEGLWEVRGGAKPFVSSRVMSWVAFDRAIRLQLKRGVPGEFTRWITARDTIYRQVMDQGWSEQKQSFVQYYGSDAVDASALLMALMRFSGGTEPRLRATTDRIGRELATGALVHRYNPQQAASDGLSGGEGTFAACGFWFAEVTARTGHLQEGRLLLERMLSYGNHLGLYAEEVGTRGEALGNYPQALTHLSLITACLSIDRLLDASGEQGL